MLNNSDLSQKYTSIGGQAVIEGVMMRSPNTFIVAVRQEDGTIRVRRDQWFGLFKKNKFLKLPFVRGVFILLETMANGIVALNYSARIAMASEMIKKAEKNGVTREDAVKKEKEKEKVGLATWISIAASLVFGILLFKALPHFLTALFADSTHASWGLQSFTFHTIDGVLKAFIFIFYIVIIGFIPDIRRVFQYHGAEHKSISTFEAQEELTIENAKKYTTFHPRCGTTFIFFLLFISIIIFAVFFALVPVGAGLPTVLKHLLAVGTKILLVFPIAGLSYELIKLMGKKCDTWWGKILSTPGLLLQRLTTREPADDQLEVALVSIKAALFLEEKYNLKNVGQDMKVITLEEVEISGLNDVEKSNFKLADFLE
ncbi:MAG: hypothetical protein A2381_13045 [Bdellovibrionales bacterium RIFOXYB1_FULL_37_110]|nr:MAG: hypothetical protein A2181_02370 [Bdellovibrionales bacterium RIFOXYA1_FULL_38_20]OFZ51634.1 MAG: hypothetical protein A2417_12705 [Bdellovibrionales bacterium RIFOXYC1_FULL_37_79]OFZ60461.1 MAG: hypothetical protein A2381_13045 [Bdellovibrionales bacterium RIFOXYB1_FULL_37_110]OFZ65034.1 MAG: hypothetical protein A2577_09310 [Bdellovibrionales bacterium RIFOXYD1_FULL_36_51]